MSMCLLHFVSPWLGILSRITDMTMRSMSPIAVAESFTVIPIITSDHGTVVSIYGHDLVCLSLPGTHACLTLASDINLGIGRGYACMGVVVTFQCSV